MFSYLMRTYYFNSSVFNYSLFDIYTIKYAVMLQQLYLYSFDVCDIALPFLFIYIYFYHLRLCPPHHDPTDRLYDW